MYYRMKKKNGLIYFQIVVVMFPTDQDSNQGNPLENDTHNCTYRIVFINVEHWLGSDD